MRALLAAHDDTKRRVFVADSFQGIPESRRLVPAAASTADATGHGRQTTSEDEGLKEECDDWVSVSPAS